MKKFLFLSGLSMLAVFSLTACEDNSGGGTAPVIVSPDYESLTGTYDIEFFYTNAGLFPLTNNCSAIPAYVGANATQCQDPVADNSAFHGKGTIRYDNETNLLHVITKVQLSSGNFNRAEGLFVNFVDPNKYNYTVFTPIPVNATIDNIINSPRSEKSVKGVTGRNAAAKTPEGASENTYQFTVYSDGMVVNNMTDKSSITPVPVVVRMKKVSDMVEDLKPNEAFETPKIGDVFVDDVGYSPQAE